MWQPMLRHQKWQNLLASDFSKLLTKALIGNYQGFFLPNKNWVCCNLLNTKEIYHLKAFDEIS